MDRHLDRLVRVLDRCHEADKAARKERRAHMRAMQAANEEQKRVDAERRAQSDVFYENLKILREMQERTNEQLRGQAGTDDPDKA